jgi:DNA-binding SARP family transcriptional activator
VLGDFVIEVQGQAGDQAASAKQRPRELLSYLILAGPKGLAQEDLAARFWPDSEPEQALNSLYVTLHRLRRGVLGDAEAVVSDGGRARLNPDRVRVDAWEFQKLAAKPKHAEAQVLDAALELYGGAAQLRGVDEIDLETWQVELAAALEAVATQRAGRLEQSDPGLALPIYRQALNHVPLSEALWAGVLRCEAALGDQVALRRSFNLMTKRYQRDTEMGPPPVLEELYKSLTHGAPKDAVQDPVA